MTVDRVTPDPVLVARALAGLRRDPDGVLTVGVTGTKGKTSTTEFIGQLMTARGLRTAVLTGESARVDARPVRVCDHLEHMRTFMHRCRQARVQCFVMELCSKTLVWKAHRGLDLDAAILTNIGTDHIPDHGNVRNYLAVKRRMFHDLRVSSASPRPVAILNADDARGRLFVRGLARGVRSITYGVAARLADSIVITSDNARTEDPRAIAQAILRGIQPVDRRRVRVELDRAQAIRGAITEARVVDVVVLLGKGAERFQEIGGRRIPFSDERSARRALDARGRLGSPTPSRKHPPWAMLSV